MRNPQAVDAMQIPKIRSLQEVIADRLLLIYFVFRNRRKGNAISGTNFQRQVKLQKLLYKSEERMFLDRCKALNYHFFKWTHGPFSQELYKDVEHLESNELLCVTEDELKATEKSTDLLSHIDEIIMNKDEILGYFERIINEFGSYDWNEINDILYGYPTIGSMVLIRDVKKGDLILPKLEDSESETRIIINDDWFETLEILFDPHMYHAIVDSINAMKHDRGQPFRPVIRKPQL